MVVDSSLKGVVAIINSKVVKIKEIKVYQTLFLLSSTKIRAPNQSPKEMWAYEVHQIVQSVESLIRVNV